MARRGGRSPVRTPAKPSPGQDRKPGPWSAELDGREIEPTTVRVGELLRRISLGALAALVTARAYWPSEPDLREGAGSGLLWVLTLLVVAGLGIAAPLVGGRLRFRISWTDLVVLALIVLIGLSSTRGLDHRVAINLAWEWVGLGVAYILIRNLPRTQAESRALAGLLVASAVAVSAYAPYQVRVEFPELQRRFLQDPGAMMRKIGMTPTPGSIQTFYNRLVGSNEAYSTFGLPNSLGGFLVGPLVLTLGVFLRNLGTTRARKPLATPLLMASLPLLLMLTCIVLTKSRSAWIGLAVGLAIVASQTHRRIPTRPLVGVGVFAVLVVGVLTAAGLATGQLDREVLTQSPKSLRYRLEYWQASWGVISGGATTVGGVLSSPTFWEGVGPGNFGSAYLRHKLPQASEEIQDPHNLFIEVWCTAGIWAFLALAVALGLGVWNLLAPERLPAGAEAGTSNTLEDPAPTEPEDESPAPPGQGWLVFAGGLGWILVLIVGQLNPFEDDLFLRWMILGAGWLIAVMLGSSLWGRLPLAGPMFGAAVIGVVINLLAAGGIGIPTVALSLWSLLALGLNLRSDRGCGRLRQVDSRIPSFALAVAWSALLGSFVGAIQPFWKSESALAIAARAMAQDPPDFEKARRAYEAARALDPYSPRPWLGEAYLQHMAWQARGARPEDQRWRMIPVLLLKAASGERNPNAWLLHRERAEVTRDLLRQVRNGLAPREVIQLQASIVEATRTASRLYPTNAMLHAQLAEASAEVSMFQDAESEAKEAIRLDELTPHPDKKLPGEVRKRLQQALPDWSEKAATFKLQVTP